MDNLSRDSAVSRRRFIAASTTAAAVALTSRRLLGAPAVQTDSKTGALPVIGDGDYRYEADHNWAKLPDKYTWQTTHNVAVDSEGLIYIIHEGVKNQPDHPSIFVFDADGNYVRSFGQQFQGGGHGLEVRNETGQDFLYVTAYKELKFFAKLDTKGEEVWRRGAPMASGLYAAEEASHPTGEWGRNRFMPTNFAFLPDGGFLLADGYGAYRVHRYNSAGEWQSSFGEPGKGPVQFDTPHGLWIDDRGDGEPLVVVADRANRRLQWRTLAGDHVRTQDGFGLPANVDRRGELLLVPDLQAEVILLNGENEVVARLGSDPAWTKEVMEMKVRVNPSKWQAGRFVHPHDACFVGDDIFVAEWVAGGRVSKLRRVS